MRRGSLRRWRSAATATTGSRGSTSRSRCSSSARRAARLRRAGRRRQVVPRHAGRRVCGSRCATSRTTCRPSSTPSSAARASCARSATGSMPAPAAHAARPGGNRQDAPGRPLRPRLARRLAGRRLVLRSLRSASLDGIHFAVGTALGVRARPATRGADRRMRSPRAAAASSCSTTSSRSSRTPTRPSAAGSTARPRRAFLVDEPRAPERRRARRCCASSRCRSTAPPSSCSSCARAPCAPTSRLDAGAARALSREIVAPARRPAAGDRAGGGAHRRAVAGAAAAAPARPLQAARRRHGAAGRQATLRAAIDWSWDLLSAWEQAALEQCSVFEGGFTLAAAEAVIDLRRGRRRRR